MIKFGFTLNEKIQFKEKLPNHCFYMKPAFTKFNDNKFQVVLNSLSAIKRGKNIFNNFALILPHIKIVIEIIAIKLKLKTKYFDLLYISEQIPNSNSFVSLSNNLDIFGYPIAKIHWNVKNEDIVLLKNSLNFLGENLFNGENEMILSKKYITEWNKKFRSASHHLGTARMSKSSIKGVVDKNLKVFNFENLFICDGSVFPTSGNANSSLTISALSCRLADYLKKLKN